MFEALKLIQTGKIRDFPVVLSAADYWSGLVAWIRDRPVAQGAVDIADLGLLSVTDDAEEVCALVRTGFERQATAVESTERKP